VKGVLPNAWLHIPTITYLYLQNKEILVNNEMCVLCDILS